MLSEEEKRKIANFVGLGAVRYALVDVDSSKPVVFTWERVLNFETNSAPYVAIHPRKSLQHPAQSRARNQRTPGYELLVEKLERELGVNLAGFPDAFVEATEYLKPNMIADYANALADKFNTFYNALPVLKADSDRLIDARLTLTQAIEIVMHNALTLIGSCRARQNVTSPFIKLHD